jgi:uncharacterized membrane-anchored protein YhcB (DUF1043 family)
MVSIILLIIGIALGVVIAWLRATVRSASVVQKVQVEAEGRVKSAESTLSEVRAEVRRTRLLGAFGACPGVCRAVHSR